MSTTLGAAQGAYLSLKNHRRGARENRPVHYAFPPRRSRSNGSDKLRARLTGEAPNFDFYYDGATASAFAPVNKVYSTVEAPPTIDTMVPAMQQETGIRFVSAPSFSAILMAC